VTATPIVHVTDDASRAQIEQAIRALRLKATRMPKHWVDRRQQVDDEVDQLVERWLAAGS
jgi:hypothetical protein